MTDNRTQIDLEKSLAELEAIVTQLEAGDLPLEASLRQFERGVGLSRDCQAALKAAEQRVQALMGEELRDLDPETLQECAPAPPEDEL